MTSEAQKALDEIEDKFLRINIFAFEAEIKTIRTALQSTQWMPTAQEFLQHLSVMWKEYAQCPDDKLSADAQMLKKATLRITNRPADTIAVPREVLQGVMENLNDIVSHDATIDIVDVLSKSEREMVEAAQQALASLDAVLAEGE